MYATDELAQPRTSTSQEQPLLEVKNLAVSFAIHGTEVPAVRDVSFKIPQGKTVALVGESGSGKSVTAQAILGILPGSASIRSGEILFHDSQRRVDIASLAPTSNAMRDLRGNQISIIFQEPMVSLSPVHKLQDQIGEALRLHRKVTAAETRQAVLSMLEKTGFPDPEKALNQYPFELSGGLRQRAMIAMALICQPALLIADEPTTALDVTVQAQILQLIKSLQQEFSMSVLLITHDLGVVANMADDVVVMFHGEVVERGPIQTLFSNPRHPYLKALFAAIPSFDMEDGARLTSLRPVTLDTHYVQAHRHIWTDAEKQAAPHLSIQNLGKDYHSRHGSWQGKSRTVHAVRDFSLDIAPGESFGLVGESGCGKTTLCKMLMRAISPSSGGITYSDRGTPIDLLQMDEEPLRHFRQKMQFVFQDPFSSLSPRMTVLDILCEPFVIHGIGTPDFRRQRARELMSLVGLDNRFLNRYPHSFSGGQRQRISIARALALEPDLLILDEPVSALDVSVQAQILNLLKDLQQNLGLTYLFISHNLAVVDYIADRIGVMCRGQLVEVAPRHTLFRQPLHPYTHALLAAIPYAELERPLDYTQLDRKHMDPGAWPEPYRLINDDPGQMHEVSSGHLIREASR